MPCLRTGKTWLEGASPRGPVSLRAPFAMNSVNPAVSPQLARPRDLARWMHASWPVAPGGGECSSHGPAPGRGRRRGAPPGTSPFAAAHPADRMAPLRAACVGQGPCQRRSRTRQPAGCLSSYQIFPIQSPESRLRSGWKLPVAVLPLDRSMLRELRSDARRAFRAPSHP